MDLLPTTGSLQNALERRKSGRGAVNKRFAALARRDWEELVTMWESDVRVAEEREQRRGSRPQVNDRQEEDTEKLKLEVISLVASSQVSKAMSRISSHGVASMQDERIKAQMTAKYSVRETAFPVRVIKGRTIEHMRGLKDSLKNMSKRRGKAPGTGGLRSEFLQVLGELLSDDHTRLLEDFGLRYLHGELQAWFYIVWLTVQTVPLFKTKNRDTVRPIGVRNNLPKMFHQEPIQQNKSELREALEPQQLAMSPAGAAKLVHTVRMMMEENPDMAAVKIDVKNAFNEVLREAIITALSDDPSLQHMAWSASTRKWP